MIDQQILSFPHVWRRLAAIIYDSLLILALSMAYGGVALAINYFLLGNNEPFVSGMAFQLGWLIVLLGFFCFFWIKAGQTLGMRAWRLVVVDKETQEYPSIYQCLGRCLLAPIGLSLFVIALVRKDRQCLHDNLTHTQILLLKKAKK